MEIVEELKKKIQCEKCHKPYSAERHAHIHSDCGHHTCRRCLHGDPYDDNYQCPICRCSTTVAAVPLLDELPTMLNNCLTLIAKSDEIEKALRMENSGLKQEIEQWKAMREEDQQKCVECEKRDSEQDMQLCKTCHGLKFENHDDFEKNTLCSTCAIKKHIRKGHQIVDVFPYLSAYNFSSKSSEIDSKSDEFRSGRVLLKNTISDFNALSGKVSENYNVLTDMAKRSKNTKSQIEFFGKMGKFINESKTIHGDADSDMKSHTTKLEGTLTEVKEWYESRMGNCVDESETIKLANSDDSDENDTEA